MWLLFYEKFQTTLRIMRSATYKEISRKCHLQMGFFAWHGRKNKASACHHIHLRNHLWTSIHPLQKNKRGINHSALLHFAHLCTLHLHFIQVNCLNCLRDPENFTQHSFLHIFLPPSEEIVGDGIRKNYPPSSQVNCTFANSLNNHNILVWNLTWGQVCLFSCAGWC